MKKYVLLFFAMLLCLSVWAKNSLPLKYKNIGIKQRISFNQELNNWYYSDKKDANYFEKTISTDGNNIYVNKDKSFAFSTDCDYEFIKNGQFICYLNSDLNFYEINLSGDVIVKAPLTEDEIAEIIPNFKVIKISEFNQNTNSYKMKKHLGKLNIFILNDTGYKFGNYIFTSNNADINNYSLNGFAKIKSSGMIQFSSENDCNKPWYVLLVR